MAARAKSCLNFIKTDTLRNFIESQDDNTGGHRMFVKNYMFNHSIENHEQIKYTIISDPTCLGTWLTVIPEAK